MNGAGSGLKAKTLNRDPKTGAVSLLLYYPPGWRYHTGYEEIFVLEGDLTIGQRTLTNRYYSFIPAGMAPAGPAVRSDGPLGDD